MHSDEVRQPEAQILDLADIVTQARDAGIIGPAWSFASADLNVNLVRFQVGDGVAAHVNTEVDVLGIVVTGEGIVEIGEREERVRAGQLFFVPKGTRRATRAVSDDFAYLTCHRRRAGLMPGRAPRRKA